MNVLEKRIIELSYKYKLTHISSCLNCVNLLSWIYSTKNKDDIVVFANGHAGLSLYVCLEANGYCDAEEMVTKHGVHPSRDIEHGIYVSSGSLGQAETIAVGLALADKNRKVWLVTSDGACMEGAAWEAMRAGDKYCHSNLETFIVFNGLGAYGKIHEHELPRFSNVRVYKVDTRHYPEFLQGLQGHYIQLSEEQYQELIKEYATSRFKYLSEMQEMGNICFG